MMSKFVVALAAAALCSAAQAATVRVDIYSQVDGRYANSWFNSNSPLAPVQMSDAVHMSFTVDSTVFSTGATGYRGYTINPSSFTLTMGSVTTGLMTPYPAGLGAPMFLMANDDPGVDRFSVSTTADFLSDPYLNAVGQFDNYSVNCALTYAGDTISSLDILDAVGTYTWTNMQHPSMYINDSFATRLEMYSFDHMTIALVPAPSALGAAVPVVMLAARRRRRGV